MNKSSIRKIMATSVLTAFMAMSNIQLVSAASSGCSGNLGRTNLKGLTTNCANGQYNLNDLTSCLKGQTGGVKGATDCSKDPSSCVKGVTDCAKAPSNCGTKSGNTDCKDGSCGATSTTKANTSPSKSTAVQPKSTADTSVKALEKEVITLVNAERAKAKLPALKANDSLSNVARLKSQDMIDKKYFSHTSPTYGSPFDMMKKYGVKYTAAGENIASGYPSAKAVVDGWMKSPGHRANILSKSFTEIGVGLAKSSNGTYYWTQMFINPGK
ncbi:CAP domain-containing protein [Clostridium sp. Marseille-Q2269]|uniref:CAP domain-containing protein n=1 Tax=Clostridium sp. Marseille-Q2269 TaxID=2942205 RepID=UPI0020741A66|nr:CAP domain-containing protein [Clostridium sp. Marseille-Q2269]